MTKIDSSRRKNDDLANPYVIALACDFYVGNPFQMAGRDYESYGNTKRLCLHSISHPSESKFHNFLVSLAGLDWPGLAWTGLAWPGLAWPGLVWTGLAWPGLDCSGLAWPGLDWTGLAWSSLAWLGLD